MKVSEFLTKDKWCREHHAVDACGEPIAAKSEFAVRWCLLGVAEVCYNTGDIVCTPLHTKVLNIIQKRYPDRDYAGWSFFNDDPLVTFDDIMEVVREADL